jgi:hypothetical protein
VKTLKVTIQPDHKLYKVVILSSYGKKVPYYLKVIYVYFSKICETMKLTVSCSTSKTWKKRQLILLQLTLISENLQ